MLCKRNSSSALHRFLYPIAFMGMLSCIWTGCELANLSYIYCCDAKMHMHTAIRKGPAACLSVAYHRNTCEIKKLHMHRRSWCRCSLLLNFLPYKRAIVSTHGTLLASPCDRPGPCYWTKARTYVHILIRKLRLISAIFSFPQIVSFQGEKVSVASTRRFWPFTFSKSHL